MIRPSKAILFCSIQILAMMALAGCGPRRPANPGTLVAPSSVPGDWMMEQQVTAIRQGKKGQPFRAVAQKQGDSLLVMGLTPMGTRAFVIEQQGTDVTFDKQGDMHLPFEPEMILHDVQRTFVKSLFNSAPPDGTHQGEIAGEEVTEVWEDGHLTQRRYTRDDADGAVVIDFGLPGDDGAPGRVTLDNQWFGYKLIIETLSYQPL